MRCIDRIFVGWLEHRLETSIRETRDETKGDDDDAGRSTTQTSRVKRRDPEKEDQYCITPRRRMIYVIINASS